MNENEKDVDYLRMFAIETQSQMKSLVEAEYKWLHVYIFAIPIVFTFLGTIGNLLKGHKRADEFFSVASIVSFGFLFLLTFLICSKIQREHKKYKNFGEQLVRMWKYFNLFEKELYIDEQILDNKAKNYGQGKGYIFSIIMLCLLTITTTIIIYLIVFYCALYGILSVSNS